MGWTSNTAGMPQGLTGATAASRFAGATADGIPTTGTFAVGDWIVSQADGAQYVCITAGTPGTWRLVGDQARIVGAATGALRETIPRMHTNLTGVSTLTSGTECASAIWLPAGEAVTNLSFETSANQTGPTHWWFALRDLATRSVIRQSTDQLTTAWNTAGTIKTLALDSIPTTAGARVASTTVTLTIPTCFQTVAAMCAAGDSIVVSNANIAAYNGTFTVDSVTSTTIVYTAGSSATDSLSAPFPTVKLAATKKVFTPTASGLYYATMMIVATVGNMIVGAGSANANGNAPITAGTLDASLTGTALSPGTALTAIAQRLYGYTS